MRKRRHAWLLLVSILSLGASVYLALCFPPTYQLPVGNFLFPVLPVFLIFLFLFIFSFFSFVFKNSRRGFLLGLFVIAYLLLRLTKLTSPFFLIMLFVLFGGIELFFIKKK